MVSKDLIYGLVVGVLGAILIFHVVPYSKELSEDELIALYYESESAALVSPHNLRERMSHGTDNFVLVDTRTVEDYEREHVIGAVNIDSSQSPEKVVSAFKALVGESVNKEVIIYCYSASCINGRKVGRLLSQNDIFVREMTVGWNEWRYGWETWNYDTEWEEYSVENYVISGSEPGELEVTEVPPGCDIEGELGC